MATETDCSQIKVSSPEEAANLAILLVGACRGQKVVVDWSGEVQTSIPLHLPEGSSVMLVGNRTARTAIVGGATTFPLVSVQSSVLTLKFLEIFGGTHGGIVATQSNVTAENCVFAQNAVAKGDGAAISLDGGRLDLRECVLVGNHATGRGGALYTEEDTSLYLTACNFTDNLAESRGGAVYATHMDASNGTTVFIRNTAGTSTTHGVGENDSDEATGAGGAVYLHAGNSTATDKAIRNTPVSLFRDGDCSENEARGKGAAGGCIWLEAVELEVENGTFSGNTAEGTGGAIQSGPSSVLRMLGGNVQDNRSKSGGALFIDERAEYVAISDGTFARNKAENDGGAVIVDRAPSKQASSEERVTISGSNFEENVANGDGGAIYVRDGGVVDIISGLFLRNTARYNGGCISLIGSTLRCQEATMQNNSAGDQGGGIYAQGALGITSQCDAIGNSARTGGAFYVVNSDVLNITGATLRDNGNAEGGVLHVQNGTVIARDVLFSETQSRLGVGAIEVTSASSILEALNCSFTGWVGDSMIVNGGQATLDECNFEGTSATTLVYSTSLAQPAVIRNAELGPLNFANEKDSPGSLVDGVATCEDAVNAGGVCVRGCVPGAAGVYCRCYVQAITRQLICTNNAGQIEVTVGKPPVATEAPDDIVYELHVSSATPHIDVDDNYTAMVWYLEGLPDPDVETSIVPYSGILKPGSTQTVVVTKSPRQTPQVVFEGGVVARGLYPQSSQLVTVNITYYQCPQYSFADFRKGNMSCMFCSDLDYSEGVDCAIEGASVRQLPIKSGFWRQTTDSLTVKACPFPDACLGSISEDNSIRIIQSTDDYCKPGSHGKYCAECRPGYAGRNGLACSNCDDAYFVAGMKVLLFFTVFLIVLIWVLITIYLIGGVKAASSASAKIYGATQRLVCRKQPYPLAMDSFGAEPQKHDAQASRIQSQSGRFNTVRTLPIDSLRSASGCREHAGRSLRSLRTRSGEGHLPINAPSSVGCAERAKQLLTRFVHWVPFRKLRILIVVWQILTQFPEVAYVSYPRPYSNFLSCMDFINLNFVSMFSVSCAFTGINFYHELLAVTLVPLAIMVIMAFTFAKASRDTVNSPRARQQAVARHMAVGLLVAFLILSSTSTTIAKTFMCETFGDLGGRRFLKADYSISCDTWEYRAYRAYAALMVVYYPIGIPVLFLALLWANKDRLNPEVHFATQSAATITVAPEDVARAQEATRAADPSLKPTRLLWAGYTPGHYTYEVVECGRRLLLTSALVMIEPGTTTQCALACVFAFLSLVAFELIMPYTSKDDAWLYRMGCALVFFSNFLALMMKAQIAGAGEHRVFAALLVIVNVSLFISIWFSAWVSAKDATDATHKFIHRSSPKREPSVKGLRTEATIARPSSSASTPARRRGGFHRSPFVFRLRQIVSRTPRSVYPAHAVGPPPLRPVAEER